MKKTALIVVLGWITATGTVAQTDSSHVRKQTMDYTRFDRLNSDIFTAGDKAVAARQLLQVTDQLFTVRDEEYFQARVNAARAYQQIYQHARASQLFLEAIDAFENHFPFYKRYTVPFVTEETALLAYTEYASLLSTMQLHDKAARYLESKKDRLETHPSYALRQMYYTSYAQALVNTGQYKEAIAVALSFKELVESGKLVIQIPSPEEIFKINDDYPEEVKTQMRKAKEQYEVTYRQSLEMARSGQRFTYNACLARAYFEMFDFESCLPYARAMSDEMNKQQAYVRKSYEDARIQMDTNRYVPDSTRLLVKEGIAYAQLAQQTGGIHLIAVISAMKTGQASLASQYAESLIEQAVLYQLQGKPAEAEKIYQQLFTRIRNFNTSKTYQTSKAQLEESYRKTYLTQQILSGKLTEAYTESKKQLQKEESQLDQNFQFFSESEKKEFFKTYMEKLDRHLSLLLKMNEQTHDRTEELLDKILQTKGIVLDATREQDRQLRKIKDQTLLKQIREVRSLREKLSAFYQLTIKSPNVSLMDSVSRLSLRISQMERAINEKLPPTQIWKSVSWKNVQAKLRTGQVYVEIIRLKRDYFSFDKPVIQYWAFVIKPGEERPLMFQLPDGDKLEGQGLRNYQNRIRTQQDDPQSYSLYWSKLEEQTGPVSTVFLSADGAYHMINPLTLQNPKTNKFLLSELSLIRISTGRDFIKTNQASTGKEIILVGNPDFTMSRKNQQNSSQQTHTDLSEAPVRTRSGFLSLPGTQREVATIETLAHQKGMQPKVLASIQANESNIKRIQSPAVLHVATHGEFDQWSKADSYLRSKLILAGAGDPENFSLKDYSRFEDGFLTAYEVTQLDLTQTNLVVLSACETGLGELQSGEGVWGLQRAFQLAGAQTVMGSLWKISDEATVLFMEAFYRHYLSGLGIHQAYGEAMKVTLETYEHPYFWGAFTLTGAN